MKAPRTKGKARVNAEIREEQRRERERAAAHEAWGRFWRDVDLRPWLVKRLREMEKDDKWK